MRGLGLQPKRWEIPARPAPAHLKHREREGKRNHVEPEVRDSQAARHDR
jgi:hypothetical protein